VSIFAAYESIFGYSALFMESLDCLLSTHQGTEDMKTLTTLALTVALSSGAFSVQAAGQDDRELEVCKTELRAYYGEETELNLVDRRRNQHGTRMRVAARLDADNSYFATCWVPRQVEDRFAYGDDRPALASTDSVVVSR
jgi:hypothetical protein